MATQATGSCTVSSDLHKRLVALQSTGELRRKAHKSRRRGVWTQEENDYGSRRVAWLWEGLFVEDVSIDDGTITVSLHTGDPKLGVDFAI